MTLLGSRWRRVDNTTVFEVLNEFGGYVVVENVDGPPRPRRILRRDLQTPSRYQRTKQ